MNDLDRLREKLADADLRLEKGYRINIPELEYVADVTVLVGTIHTLTAENAKLKAKLEKVVAAGDELERNTAVASNSMIGSIGTMEVATVFVLDLRAALDEAKEIDHD